MQVHCIVEGGVPAVMYLANNRLNFDVIHLEALSINSRIPYMTENDKVVIILQGLITFSNTEMREVIRVLEDSGRVGGRDIILFSSVLLPFNVDFPYFIYEEDLMHGRVWVKTKSSLVLLEETVEYKNLQNSSAVGVLNGVLLPFVNYGVSLEELLTRVVSIPDVYLYDKDKAANEQGEQFIKETSSREVILVDMYTGR